MNLARTLSFRRRHLPHWEVDGGRYFITVRCADSLPGEAMKRLEEMACSLATVEARSEQFSAMQRQIFLTLEKYLDAGHGACPLRQSDVAAVVVKEFEALGEWQVDVPHFTIMPNHWHAILVPRNGAPRPLGMVLKRLKGRTGKQIRSALGQRGPFWQGEWFDRWIRNDAEWERTVRYIRNNPVKAGLVGTWTDHTWTR